MGTSTKSHVTSTRVCKLFFQKFSVWGLVRRSFRGAQGRSLSGRPPEKRGRRLWVSGRKDRGKTKELQDEGRLYVPSVRVEHGVIGLQ